MKLSLGPFRSLAPLALSVLVVGGCAADAADADSRSASDSADGQHEDFPRTDSVGNLAYGRTEWADHPALAPYRAFTFDVREGDVVEIHVRAIGHDAVAWLVSEKSKVVTRANEVRGTGAEVIVYEARETARMQIAFREASDRPSRFEITLLDRGAGQTIADATRVTE
jgi:hypothetical protein